ncbi:MAG: undecaprenyl-diphosphate phosphatase [Deltaproteobacteria bacterium]|nr:undecaprenyl-diphosphate phosphatase [Deltaproteobacteria bacterium]
MLMMGAFTDATLLGILQGLTEFLPVSSSGHIALAEMALGMHDAPLTLSVLLHAGTLVATLIVMRRDVAELLRAGVDLLRSPRRALGTERGKLLLAVILASVPTAILGLLLRDRVESLGRVPLAVGLALLASAAAVLSTRWARGEAQVPTLQQALVVGLVQGVAVLPGVSRSGSTIAAAMLLGLSGDAAFRFSFLLSLPAVGGAVLLEARHVTDLGALAGPGALGALIALGVGVLALIGLRRVVGRGQLSLFALYLVPLALVVLALPLFR